MLEKEKGFFRDIGDDIWERVDEKGEIMGLAILNFRKRAEKGENRAAIQVEPFSLFS